MVKTKRIQLQKFKIGISDAEGNVLFSRPAIRESLLEVSKVRLEQTIYAEYPRLRPFIENLDGEKATQNLKSLADAWKQDAETTRRTADALVEIGFFELLGTRDEPIYRVPFLYREALNLVQGAADE